MSDSCPVLRLAHAWRHANAKRRTDSAEFINSDENAKVDGLTFLGKNPSSEHADLDDEDYDFSVSGDLATPACDNDCVGVAWDKWVRSGLKEGDFLCVA
jgi:hypothetical protein